MVTGDQTPALPISGIRVLDLSDGLCEGAGRILADLGADVIKIESPSGAPSRLLGVRDDGISLTFAAANVNKRSAVIDLDTADGREDFLCLTRNADLVIAGGPGAQELSAEVTPEKLLQENPALIVLELSWFGKTGPYRDWIGTNDVLAAVTGLLAKSGLPDREPLLPPEHLVDAAASSQAAWTAMLAVWKQASSGLGELIDFSVFEAVAVSLDPAFGISGSARGAASDLPRGRPDARHLYPMFACADGWVRICLLSARQWSNMFEWMGRPEELSDPKYAVLRERHKAEAIITPVLKKFFATRTRAQVVEESVQFGVPAAGLLYPSDVFTAPHYLARNTFVDVSVGSRTAKMPQNYFEIDGVGIGYRTPAPSVGEHTADVLVADPVPRPRRSTREQHSPFAGLRVLDLGVIVAGAEAGRLFSDWGADVIKVENRQYPDGNRQSAGPNDVTQSFARGHRNKRSLGLNLRSERGQELFLDLVRKSDVLLSNFKPGTLESLGIGYDTLKQTNPRLIMADSSAFGPAGPWSRRMGYGPLVRASTGLSWLWSYPGDDDGFSDAITIYPDHVASRFVATAVIALLIRREQTGLGGTASVAQIDVLLGQMADRFMAESLHPGTLTIAGNFRGGDAPRGIFRCDGDDEWCVIDVQTDEHFRALAEAVDMSEWFDREAFASAQGRVAHRDEIEQHVRSWISTQAPREVMTLLQKRGVPCGFMQRASEFDEDPQFSARSFLRFQDQPQFGGALVAQNGEAVFSSIGVPQFGAAPIHGEHTAEVCAEVLGMDEAEIAELIADGILEVPESVAALESERGTA
ncbi:CaiB/BaiF CoA-transferase family protein [Nocardia sp. 348MFTsu5.1]|uniref:CaiB/BaiF CoA transferase family protein n=1 Tax=Nocardia sp. 348MFTsu5.1 TaxID=1172185 RepID=UPI000360904C|nr:CoA transferase [Nocardia sp. 348MFTsu5.1]